MATEKKKPITVKKTTPKKVTPKKAVIKKPIAKKKVTSKKTASAATKVSSASAKIEKQFDEAMKDTQKLIKSNVSPKTKKTVKNVTKKAEAFAGTVEHFGEEVENFTDSIFPTSTGSTSTFDAQYSSKVSRLFIFRFLWIILQGPIIGIRSLWMCLITIIHWITMFLSGKRNKTLRKKQRRFWKHVIGWKAYMNGLTDSRPEIISNPV